MTLLVYVRHFLVPQLHLGDIVIQYGKKEIWRAF
jgi:hypothetical protein